MNNLSRRLVAFSAVALLSVAAAAQPPAVAPPAPVTPPQVNTPQDPPLNPKLPTLFIVGDSTARNGADLGWGDHLAHYFDTTRINVANRSRAGEAAAPTWSRACGTRHLAEMKPGDFVMLQWGHNDGGDLGGNKPRGSLPGDSDATQDVPQTTGVLAGKTETIHTYGWYNRKYVADTIARGATPMFLSMTIRNVWKPDANGVQRIERETNFNAIMKKIAGEEPPRLHRHGIRRGGPPGGHRAGEDRAALPHRPHPHQRPGRGVECAVGGHRAGRGQLAPGGFSEGESPPARDGPGSGKVTQFSQEISE